MARYSIDGQILTDMADAIRANKGESPPSSIAGTGELLISNFSDLNLFDFNQVIGQRYRLTFYCNKNVSSSNLSFYGIYFHGDEAGEDTYYKVQTEPQTITGICTNDVLFEVNGGLLASTPLTIYYTIEYIDVNGETMSFGKAYTPEDVVEVLENIPSAPAPIVLTSSCDYACSGEMASTYIRMFGDTISTRDITSARNMFFNYQNETIPFEINFSNKDNTSSWDYHYCAGLFSNANITEVPVINSHFKPESTDSMFMNCKYLRNIPEDFGSNWNWSVIDGADSAWSATRAQTFLYCNSLRSIPVSFLNHGNPYAYDSYTIFYYSFKNCYALDELILPNPHTKTSYTSNMFYSTVDGCARLKNFLFAEPNQKVEWANQTIYLADQIGHIAAPYRFMIYDYNSGITKDKEVTDDASYQALKDDPDWFTCNSAYSRYNHDSAVATINSLPDTSEFLSTNGGTNTIVFQGYAGTNTDGGAISNLTEEEIAVAAAKGWTVTFI